MKQIITVLLLSVLLFSCSSTVNISEDLSPAELIQRAQEASDKNRYKIALQYYNALYDRNPANIDLIITAEYEIAFIYYKQGNFEEARKGLRGVLSYYNAPDQELLPQHFKKLSEIVLNRIDEKEASKHRFPWQRDKDA